MSFRYPKGGFITAFYDPLQVPNAPTIGTATVGDAQATVAFTAPSNVGGSAITAYYAVSNPDRITATGASSPITVTGLSNGTAYTFQVWALNSYGPSPFSAASGSATPFAPRAFWIAGASSSSSYTNVIDYVEIGTTGNATDFGDLDVIRQGVTSCSSSTRGLLAGGKVDGYSDTSNIQYITLGSAGNSTNFGSLSLQGGHGIAACSNSTFGIFAGGGGYSNVIQYTTIATTGDTSDFGDLTVARSFVSGCSSSTRGIFGGGFNGSYLNTIDYITIASTGNATDFGDLTVARNFAFGSNASCSNSTRGLFAGGTYSGVSYSNIIDYITIASPGNATDFGDLSAGIAGTGAAASSTRALFGGGEGSGSTIVDTIYYVEIATTGNTSSFGSLTVGRAAISACSSAHGGL